MIPDIAIPPNHLTAREAVLRLRGSKIREVANASLGKSDVLAFWFGEPDELTPEFIRRAGIASLEAGETFYTHNYGLAELRTALAAYLSRLHRPIAVEEIIVTSSGMSALMLATQALRFPGRTTDGRMRRRRRSRCRDDGSAPGWSSARHA